ncbi:hypothetical protein B6440_25260 [Salmonella enterica]|nr:hypothetical protein [Salmonella enterica]EAZ3130326.1 hypothetical protein [Salmonella enterica]ELC2813622.1 hypothetical protein [Salmonella enterica]
MAIIITTPGFGARGSPPGISPAHPDVSFGAGIQPFSSLLLAKLRPENNTGLGSNTVTGTVIPTQAGSRKILWVVNTYLTDKLTEDELKTIMDNRDKFEFTIGVGDRRTSLALRFKIATDWHGEDVTGRILTPDPTINDQNYHHTLTFSGKSGQMSVTDKHYGTNQYGSVRYFTVRYKS